MLKEAAVVKLIQIVIDVIRCRKAIISSWVFEILGKDGAVMLEALITSLTSVFQNSGDDYVKRK